MAPKSRLESLRKKLQAAVRRWTDAKERVRKLRVSLRLAKQGRKNLKVQLDRRREQFNSEFPDEDVADEDVLAGDESDDSAESSSAASS